MAHDHDVSNDIKCNRSYILILLYFGLQFWLHPAKISEIPSHVACRRLGSIVSMEKNGNRFFPKFPWFSLENQFQVDQWPHPQQGISGSVENRGWNWLVTLSTPKKGPFGSYIWGEGWTPNIVGKENPFGAPLRRPRSQVASCCTSGKARVFWLGVATVS